MWVSLTIWGSTESVSFALIDYLIRGAAQDSGGCFASGHARELHGLRKNNQGFDCDKMYVPCLHRAESTCQW